MIALLRGINVGGHRKVPMIELKAIAADLGFLNVQSYIQSGNLIFSARGSASGVERTLETALRKHFDFHVEVIVRTEAEWSRYAESPVFPEAAKNHPHLFLLGCAKRPIKSDALELLRARATNHERIEVKHDALWIDFQTSVGRSKITPTVVDKAVGSPVTMRNWKTVLKLAEMGRAVSRGI